jgi:uncharacterized protein
LKEKIAVVTGASAGIGWELAKQLANRNYELWIVARREEKLRQLADEIRRSGAPAPKVLSLDLKCRDARLCLAQQMTAAAKQLDLVVNNAGIGALGEIPSLPISRQLDMIELNITALTELSHHAAGIMCAKRAGGIVNIGSTASFLPVPYQGVYAATKAYVLSFTRSLAEEIRSYGVRVMALCPGLTRTEFQQAAGITRVDFRMKYAMTAARCAEIGLRDFDRGKLVSVTGAMNKIQITAARLFPGRMVMKVVSKAMKNLTGE